MTPLESRTNVKVARREDRSRHRIVTMALLLAWLLLVVGAERAMAASSKACTGGGFALVLADGTTVAGERDGAVPAAALGQRFLVRGRYVEFTVDAATFGVRDYTLTGAPNPLDMTGGRRTAVFAAKTPDLGGRMLTSDATVELRDEDLVIQRAGAGVSMKIQAKDCAQGGIFQMEPERADSAPTIITHTLADGVFYFDNPFFRERIGQVLAGVEVSVRVNFANDVSRDFVGRDSAQVAEKLSQTGRTSVWSVASGGRMGGVLGEDAVEVAPPATDCVEDCQAQNQVRGRFAVLGFPFPVPAASRLTGAGTPAGAAALAVTAPAPAAGAIQAAPSSSPTLAAGRVGASSPTLATPSSRFAAPMLRRSGRSVVVRAPGGARVVRVAVFRLRAGRAARRVAMREYTLKGGRRTLRVRVTRRPGRYEVRARAGRTSTRLGAVARLRLRITA
jgi:hypothetical protein